MAQVLIAIVGLCVVIIIHEFGHYITAVWTGMKVDRFSVFGIGPAIVRLGTWRGTEFVIGAIPFGAYVLIRGMEPPEDLKERPPPDPDSPNFRDKKLGWRALVIAGGPIANYLTAMLLYFAVFAIVGLKGPVLAIEVAGFSEDSPSAAQVAGIEKGDALVQIGEQAIDLDREGRDVASAAAQHRGTTTPVTVRRGEELLTFDVEIPAEGSPMGIGMQPVAGPRQPVGIGRAAYEATVTPLIVTRDQLAALYLLVRGKLQANLSGPVEIVRQIARQADRGLVPFVLMTAFISTILGMFNLLPLPALDGGRLSFLAYEAVARRRANPRVEEMVHGYGMLALLALILLVTVGDVRRLF